MEPPLWAVHGLMVLSSLLIASSFTVGQAVAPFLDPLALTLCRFLLAALLLAPLVLGRYGPGRPTWRDMLRYSAVSFTFITFFVCMFLALRYTSGLRTSVIYTLVPGISGLYARLLLGERLGAHRVLALILAMAGAAWVLCGGRPALLLGQALNRGDLIFLLGCLLMALYMPLVRLVHRGEPMPVMTLYVILAGCAWLLVPALPAMVQAQLSAVPGRVWLGIVHLALFCTVASFLITQKATLVLGPTRVMAYSYLCPPLVLLIDLCLGHGLPAPATLAGVAVIVPAMFVVQAGAGRNAARRDGAGMRV